MEGKQTQETGVLGQRRARGEWVWPQSGTTAKSGQASRPQTAGVLAFLTLQPFTTVPRAVLTP